MNREIVTQEGAPPPKEEPKTAGTMSQMEQLVYECLQYVHYSPEPNMALNRLLAFIGERFDCQRAFVFEKNIACRYDNTYEWCAPGVVSKKDLLQDESEQGMEWGIVTFQHGREVIIRDIEDIREEHPIAYAIIHAHGVRSLVVAGLWENDRLVGFFGAEEPQAEELERLAIFLRLISYFVSAILRRRELTERLEHMSYHDQLTGVWNLNAIRERIKQLEMADSIGVVYCDVNALKQINDSLGHKAGDEAIQGCARTMTEVFGEEQVYRVGGDEFLAICPGMELENFRVLVEVLKRRVAQGDCPIAVGTMWTDQKPLNLNQAIAQADADMYDSKRAYYSQVDPLSGEPRDRRRSAARSTDRRERHRPVVQSGEAKTDGPLVQYVRSNFFDGEALLRSMGDMGRACFLYFGDMQTGTFCISDNMRDTFGFEKNVVPDFISAWEKRISNQEDLQLFRQDMLRLAKEKGDQHDLWYRIRDREGNSFWIHCRGRVLWDANRENPLFFSGCVTSQESDYVVDPCTNFPRESAALRKLDELLRSDELGMVVGFSLNNFSDINEVRGRADADELLREVATRLNEHFGHRVFFYRLDGLYFLAVAAPVFREEDLPRVIQDIVRDTYRGEGFIVSRPCSVSVFRQPDPDAQVTPQSILSTIMFMTSLAKNSPEEEEEERRIDVSGMMQQKKERADLALEINRSVLNGFSGFRIVVQPIVSAAAYIVGGEALLRWTCQGKDVSPAQFIPLLEKNRLIWQVGRWVFEEVVRTCKRIVSHRPDFHLAFNVSYHQLSDEGFPAFMAETLKRFGLDGSHLVMELTETHYDETPEKLHRFVSGCKEMGMKVALDDFGSGYSSLTLLLRYPADIVKLDRALLTETTQSEDKAKFIRSVVYACHQFGKYVCMEGVENDEDMDTIRQAQCDMIQGFYFYKPLEIRDLFRLLLSDDAPFRSRLNRD